MIYKNNLHMTRILYYSLKNTPTVYNDDYLDHVYELNARSTAELLGNGRIELYKYFSDCWLLDRAEIFVGLGTSELKLDIYCYKKNTYIYILYIFFSWNKALFKTFRVIQYIINAFEKRIRNNISAKLLNTGAGGLPSSEIIDRLRIGIYGPFIKLKTFELVQCYSKQCYKNTFEKHSVEYAYSDM